MRNLKSCALTLLSVALVAALALAVTAGARTAVKSTVTIVSGSGTEFTGKVSSPKKVCRARRTVKLFRADSTTGAGSVVGTAKTNSAGTWDLEGSFLAGYYYARVQAKTVHLEKMVIDCRVDLSVRHHF
jgi:hypothetical protein